MKLDKLKLQNEAGEVADITRADYVKHVVKENSVADYTTEESGTTSANKVVDHILKSLEGGTDIDEGIAGEYAELVKIVEGDFKFTMENKVDKAAAAAEAKEKKEKEKAEAEAKAKEEKEKLVLVQTEFATSVTAGAQAASEEFASELKTLADSLPEGVTVVSKGQGFGLEFAAGVSKEVVGSALGYLIQKENNSSFIGNQLNFWVGDTLSITVERGIYPTAKEASEHLAKVMGESLGKVIEARSLPQYQRMAERTPIEYRNPQVDPSAYLAISGMAIPKKASDEKEDKYKARIAAFESDRAELQQKLSSGSILKRKEILPLVDAALIKHGLREVKAPAEFSISEQFRIFFHASFALEDLISVHKEDAVVYKKGDDKITLTREELEGMKASAYANLTNALYTDDKASVKPADFIRGFIEKESMVEVAKDANGKPIKESVKVKNLVFPLPFFEVVKPEASAAEAPATA